MATLRDVSVVPRVIQEFRPLRDSLEWDLSELYWNTTGIQGFLQNDVPYTVNNSGLLSARAAALLVASCLEAPPRGRVALMEIGAGLGLFARYLLDELQRICRRDGLDVYDRVTFYVTDRSPRTVESWREQELFAGHEEHVVTAVCDGCRPARVEPPGGASPVALSGLRAVFANYVLDSMPSTVIRKDEGGPLELFVRTHLSGDAARVAQYTRLTLEELRALAASPDPVQRARLIPLVSVFEFETAFMPSPEPRPFADEALAVGHEADRAILNYAALESLDACVELLEPAGFVVLNDYGCLQADQMAAQAATQRFGSSAALGLNFPLLEHHLAARGRHVTRPEQDALLPVHPRLVMRAEHPRTRQAFLELWSGDAHRAFELPQEQARAHIEAGRLEPAKADYQAALAQQPRDWRLLGEVAEFLIRHVADYASALKLARAALELNPWTSVWLWNVLGDALFALDRYDEAHQAYQRALAIDASDPRTHLNLAYTHLQAGDQTAALAAVAQGLAADRAGVFRSRLLEKQQQILTLVSAKHASEQDWLVRRASRLLKP